MVVSAQMDNAEGLERIGEVLVRAKRISPQQLDDALKAQHDTGDYLGQILVYQQAVSESDLKKALRLQTLETTYRLFHWKEGRYTFDQRTVEYPRQYIDPISTEHILMEGVRRLDEWPPIEKKIPSLKIVFSQVPEKRGEIEQASQPKSPIEVPAQAVEEDPFADLDQESEGRFSANEISVYHAVNGSHDVYRLIELLQIGEFEVCKALANLLSAGLIVPSSASVSVAASHPRGGMSSEFTRQLVIALTWTANLVLAAALLVIPVWATWSARSEITAIVRAEVRTLKIMMLANHLKGLGDLVEIWSAEHGTLPSSVLDPLVAYGASAWPLEDPWGRRWGYDPTAGTVEVGGIENP
jgi:hypothetical protein